MGCYEAKSAVMCCDSDAIMLLYALQLARRIAGTISVGTSIDQNIFVRLHKINDIIQSTFTLPIPKHKSVVRLVTHFFVFCCEVTKVLLVPI